MNTYSQKIEQANIIHNFKYDYSLLPNKILSSKKYDIICPEHGIFNQKWDSHIRLKTGCPKCKGKNLTLEEIILKANTVHNFKYDYSLIKSYNNIMDKYPIICPEHGVWKVTLDNHINKKTGCPKCAGKKLSRDEKINKVNIIHNFKYDYSLLPNKILDKSKYSIICPEHGIFEMEWNNHISGQKCPKCAIYGRKKRTLDSIMNQVDSLKTEYKYHWDTYINYHTPMKIECPKHGIFKQSISNHLFGQRCPICKNSKGEHVISDYLKKSNINFIPQKLFDDCINPNTGYKLKFDFFIPDKNILIEYDGELHYISVEWFGGDKTLENHRYLDNIKNKYCSENNINLLRISYKDIKNINNILDKYLNNTNELNIQKIKIFLDSLDIKYIYNNDIFYIDDYKLEIRYVDSNKHKNYNSSQNNFFKNISQHNESIGIRTIWIKDWEMSKNDNRYDFNISNNEKDYRKWNVLKSYIKNATNRITNRIYARDCEIKVISNKDLRPFLEKNCFYGYRSSSLNLGLFLKKDKNNLKKGELVMCYTFGHPYFGKNKYDIEILRVSTLLDSQVIGGSSKLLKHFLNNYQSLSINGKYISTNTIVFYVDADHNTGNSLTKLGFEYKEWTRAGFMNINSLTGNVTHRQPMEHKKIMELMKEKKLYSVSNSGTKLFVFKRPPKYEI